MKLPEKWPDQWPTPRALHHLLPRGSPYKARDESGSIITRKAAGFGLVQVLGTSGSGKSVLSHSLVDYVIQTSPRPIVYVGFAESWLDNLPERIRDNASVLPFDQIHHATPGSIMFLDDTGLFLASRRSMTKGNVSMGKFVQIARHLDICVLFTAQSTRIIDFGPQAVAEGCALVKWYDGNALRYERDEWRSRIMHAQREIRSVAPSAELARPYYYSLAEDQLAAFPAPPWALTDAVSHPYGALSPDQLGEILEG